MLLAIPDEYQLRFHAIKDAKTLWAAIKSRFGDAGYMSRDNTRRTVLVETSDALVVQDNALIVLDGLGYDWSYIAQDEPTEFAPMVYTVNSSGFDTEVQSCSKNCVKTYEKLQKQFDEQRQTLSKANLEIVAYQLGLESVEAQLVIHQKNEVVYEEKIVVLEFEVKDKRYRDHLNENDSSGSELYNSIFDSRSSDGDDNQTNDRFKKDNGYHVVPPPLTGNYMPPLADLSFAGLDDSVYRPTTNKTSASVSQVEASITPPSNTSVEMPRVESVRPSGVIIEDWVSDDEDIFQSNDLQATDKPSLKKIEFTNARNESVKPKQAKKPRMITQNPKVDRRDWNGKMTQKLGLGFGFTKKACFVCGSYSHLIKDCDFHEKRMAKKSVLKNIGPQELMVLSYKSSDEKYKNVQLMMLAGVKLLYKKPASENDNSLKEVLDNNNRFKRSYKNIWNLLVVLLLMVDLDTYNSPFADQVMGAEVDFNNMEPSTVQEPTKIAQALDDESWVEAMQEELL
ncbi:hypothetical protein Tco_0596285 [Tanacetum coccineum]